MRSHFTALAGFFWRQKEVRWKAKLLSATNYVGNIINDSGIAFTNSLVYNPDAYSGVTLLIKINANVEVKDSA